MPKKYHSSINKKQCVFCNLHANKEREIAESALAWAFPSNIPIVRGHTLVIPKRCVATFEEMTKAEREAVFTLATKIKKALVKTFKAEGFNTAWNQGEVAGQSVPHFHLHILPRKTGDTGITLYEPRKFLYQPTHYRKVNPEQKLRKIAKLIKKNL